MCKGPSRLGLDRLFMIPVLGARFEAARLWVCQMFCTGAPIEWLVSGTAG